MQHVTLLGSYQPPLIPIANLNASSAHAEPYNLDYETYWGQTRTSNYASMLCTLCKQHVSENIQPREHKFPANKCFQFDGDRVPYTNHSVTVDRRRLGYYRIYDVT
jgi:hypothetical protein